MFKEDQQGIAHLFMILLFVAMLGGIGWAVYSNIQKRESVGSQTAAKFSGGWQSRIDAAFKPSECKKKELPKLDDSYYQDPLIDAHFHPPNIPDGNPDGGDTDYLNEKLYTSMGVNITLSEIVCMFQNDGTTPRHILAFMPVYPATYKYSIELWRRTVEQHPNMFVPFINPPGDCNANDCSQTVDAKTLDKMLSEQPGLFKGYGEIGLYGHKGSDGPKPLLPDSKRIRDIMPVLRKHGIKKVFFHLGEHQRDSFDRLLRANRDITFIFHGDQLISKYKDGSQNLSQIEYLLRRNPNVYYGVDEFWNDTFLLHEKGSKKEVLNHLKNYAALLRADVATWKGFIERHPTQVMWDTDRGTYLWAMDIEIGQALVKYARKFIAKLDPDVQEKYAYKNAERAYAD